MTLDLNAIPFADRDPPPDTTPTSVLSGLKRPRQRRTFLKAMAFGAITFGAAALTVPFLGRMRDARADVSPRGGMKGYEAADCSDAYGREGYTEQADTHGIYMTEGKACFGGTYMGWNWCNLDGWHRSGDDIPSAPPGWSWECSPRMTSCAGKNAWRWTVNRKVWRCSDGNSRVRKALPGEKWSRVYLSICRAFVQAA